MFPPKSNYWQVLKSQQCFSQLYYKHGPRSLHSPPSNHTPVPKSQQRSFLSWITGDFLNLDEDVSLSRITDKFLYLSRDVSISWITNKVLNLYKVPPLNYRQVPKSQQRSFISWITGGFLNLDGDVSPQLNYGQVLKSQQRSFLSWSTGEFLNLDKSVP